MFNNIQRPRKPDLTDAAARSGPGRRRGRGPSAEPSGPAVAAAVPCAQRDPAAGEGDRATRPVRRYGARQKNEER
ncbi:hypothetical protein NDU88_010170 [Pleurodeles waltl]|uniref:Uncharacterized protein n=1 Tax=Pleurodeles waltl TaxID=8319 RepID=A0AAV7S360_PLEWA|nr:hypothetical protein NDU88_010170 [Pleurodeles waltl]